MKDKAKFEAWLEDMGIVLDTSSQDAFLEQFGKLKESVSSEDIAKQIVYNIACGKEVDFYPSNEDIVANGSLSYLIAIIKTKRNLARLSNGKDIDPKKYIGRIGKPLAIQSDDIPDISNKISDAKSDVKELFDDVIDFDEEVTNDVNDNIDKKPGYVEARSPDGLKRIFWHIEKVIVGHIVERFKQLAAYHSDADVHEAAQFLINKIQEIESMYTD